MIKGLFKMPARGHRESQEIKQAVNELKRKLNGRPDKVH